MREMALGLN